MPDAMVVSPGAPNRARLLLVLGAGVLAVSCAAIFIRYARLASGTNDPNFALLIALGRMLFAGALLGPVGLKIARLERPPRGAVVLACLAGLALALHFAFWITSLAYTSIAASTAIVTTNPVWVSIFAWLALGERPRPNVIAGIGIALAGGLLVGLGDAQTAPSPARSNPLLGDALALLGALAASAYFLLGRAAQRAGLGLTAYTGIAYATAAIALLPAPALAGVPYFGYPFEAYAWIALLGLIPQLVGHTAFNWAVRFISPALVTTVILLEPIGSALAAALLFREVPGWLTILGAACLLAGVFVAMKGPVAPRS